MCGIAGILTSDIGINIEDSLVRMQSALRHRGPDGHGLAVSRTANGTRLGMVHTRLAILDLTDAGSQPMTDPRTGSWITYNGEVYNHWEIRNRLKNDKFYSHTDTETILHSWIERGGDALNDFRGMFAFAIYDAPRQQLTLVRDRLGIKPLYVARVSHATWLFASEVRSILASRLVDVEVDRSALRSYLGYGSVIAPYTMIRGVESLLPAETWTFDLRAAGAPHRRIYWLPPLHLEPCQSTSPHSASPLGAVLQEATRLQTLSDVPIGVFLSGGIDSSAVVSALSQQGIRPHTFSVAFSESRFDESTYAREIAQYFGTAHTELHVNAADVLSNIDEALSAFDQPSIDGVNTYFISKAVRQTGITVALSGLGGDELFAGYPSFRLLAQLRSLKGRLGARILGLVMRVLRIDQPRANRLRRLLGGTSHVDRYAAFRQVTDDQDIDRLLGTDNCQHEKVLPASLTERLLWETWSLDRINAHSLLEMAIYMANTLLRDTDQMSMAHGLEVRVPLLDELLVEAVMRLPGLFKVGRRPKHILLDSLATPLPESIWQRRKMGFTFPWDRWLRHELLPFAKERLLDNSTWSKLGMCPENVRERWENFISGRKGIRYSDVLCLLHLAEWYRRREAGTSGLLSV